MKSTPLLAELIWQQAAAIPYGKVATYGQIARLCGFPGHARYVGTVMKNLPEASTLPWHRVVNAQGKIALPEQSGAWLRQKTLLEQEGIAFNNNRINLRAYGWNGLAE